MSTHHDFHPPAKFVRPKWLADVERAGLEFNERMRGIAESTCRKFFDAIDKAMENVEIPASNGSDSVESRDSDVDDIPDAEHPYMDETLYFTPEGDKAEPPIDYRWKTIGDGRLRGTFREREPSAIKLDELGELDARIGALELRFDELLKGVKAYNEKIADLISDVEMLKADNSALTGKLREHDAALALLGKELADLRKAGEAKLSSFNVEGGEPPLGVISVGGNQFGVHDDSIPTPSFPAGQESVPASEPQPLHIHPYRFIAHKDTVIDTARCGEFTTSNPAFTADMLNAGKDWYSGAYRQFPKVTERHRIFNERAAVIAQESIPLCRAVEYIILGNEMYDSVSFDLNSYLKGDGKFLKPLDRAQSICIAIDWLRVELNRLRHERWREEEARIAAGME